MAVSYESQGTPYHQDFQDGASEYLRLHNKHTESVTYSPYVTARGAAAPSQASPSRVATYPRPVEVSQTASSPPKKVSPGRMRGAYDPQAFDMKSSYPSYTGAAPSGVHEDAQAERVQEIIQHRRFSNPSTQAPPTSPFRKRPQGTTIAKARSISPPHHSLHPTSTLVPAEGIPAPSRSYEQQPAVNNIDMTAWRMRLNSIQAEELRQLISSNYDRNCSGSIDFCDFLALWFSQQLFQIKRSAATVTSEGKETETFEVQAKHIYRVREIFNEYEESYLSGIRYGLVSAMLKDLVYDRDHEVQHYYGVSTDDMVSLIEELSTHRLAKAQIGGKEPRYDFAYIFQLLFKYITDTEEIALFYDEGCKVFQALRTKEYGEQPIYQNSTVSTKLLVKLLTAFPRKEEDTSTAPFPTHKIEEELLLGSQM